MFISPKKIVTVTGLPRSGTTVLGNVLSSGYRSISLYEPMNFQSGDLRFSVSFPVFGIKNSPHEDFEKFYKDIGNLKLKLRSGEFPHEVGLRRFLKMLFGGRSRMSLRISKLNFMADTLVNKDPFATFCIDSFAKYGTRIVVTYRSPYGIAASYKRLNWCYPIEDIALRLKEKKSFAVDGALVGLPPDKISREVQGAVFLWVTSTLYYLKLMEEEDKLIIVSTGELPKSNDEVFEEIFEHAGISIDASVKNAINKSFREEQDAASPTVPDGHPHSKKRDLGAVNTYWKNVLSEEEVNYIQDHCSQLEHKISNYLI